MIDTNFSVAIIVGSARINRESHKVALYLENVLRQQMIGVNVIDLMKTPLPIMDERYSFIEHTEPNILHIAEVLKKSDAVILLSPEYTGTISGVLKNAIDFYARLMSGKPIGVVTTSNGRLGGINASHQMQHIILSMNAYPMPYKLLVSDIAKGFDEQGQPIREDIINNTQRFANEFIPFAKAIVAMRLGNFTTA